MATFPNVNVLDIFMKQREREKKRKKGEIFDPYAISRKYGLRVPGGRPTAEEEAEVMQEEQIEKLPGPMKLRYKHPSAYRAIAGALGGKEALRAIGEREKQETELGEERKLKLHEIREQLNREEHPEEFPASKEYYQHLLNKEKEKDLADRDVLVEANRLIQLKGMVWDKLQEEITKAKAAGATDKEIDALYSLYLGRNLPMEREPRRPSDWEQYNALIDKYGKEYVDEEIWPKFKGWLRPEEAEEEKPMTDYQKFNAEMELMTVLGETEENIANLEKLLEPQFSVGPGGGAGTTVYREGVPIEIAQPPTTEGLLTGLPGWKYIGITGKEAERTKEGEIDINAFINRIGIDRVVKDRDLTRVLRELQMQYLNLRSIQKRIKGIRGEERVPSVSTKESSLPNVLDPTIIKRFNDNLKKYDDEQKAAYYALHPEKESKKKLE